MIFITSLNRGPAHARVRPAPGSRVRVGPTLDVISCTRSAGGIRASACFQSRRGTITISSSTSNPVRLSIIHVDYRPDNALFTPERPPDLLALVDWEMSTLGDPFADLGYLVAAWREPGDEPLEIQTLSRATEVAGFPSRSEVVARYSDQGRAIPDLSFYVVLSIWKMTVFFEGHGAPDARGTVAGFDFRHLETGVPEC